jgi:hypothetical protein
MTNGTFDTANGTAAVTVNGNVACGVSCGTISMTATNTFTQNVAANKNFGTSVAGSTAWTFNNLTFTKSTSTPTITTSPTGTGDITVNGVLNIAASTTWNAGTHTYRLMSSGKPFTNNGTFASATSTMSYEYTGATATYIISPANNAQGYYNLQTNPASGTPTYTFQTGATSFLAGTKVLTLDGEENIENLKVGDLVTAYDTETNSNISSPITGLIHGTKDAYYIINNKVKATGNHMFFLADKTQKAVQDLKVGDALSTYGGTEIINSIEIVRQQTDVYDIEVQTYHTFYAEGYLVHNYFGAVVCKVNNNFTMTGSGNATVNANVSNYSLSVVGNFTIGASQTFQGGLSVGGNWSNSGTFTAGSSQVTFNATTTGHTINPGTSHFNAVAFSGTGGEWSPLTNKMYVDSTLTMAAGTFDNVNGTADVQVAGSVYSSATSGVINFTVNTFTQRVGTAATSLGPNSGSGNWTFYNLNLENSTSTGDLTITASSGGTGAIVVTNT